MRVELSTLTDALLLWCPANGQDQRKVGHSGDQGASKHHLGAVVEGACRGGRREEGDDSFPQEGLLIPGAAVECACLQECVEG